MQYEIETFIRYLNVKLLFPNYAYLQSRTRVSVINPQNDQRGRARPAFALSLVGFVVCVLVARGGGVILLRSPSRRRSVLTPWPHGQAIRRRRRRRSRRRRHLRQDFKFR